MKNINELIDKHFPFKDYNPGQKYAIEKTIAYLIEGVKHIIIEAPTGIGKSAIATTVHRVLNEYNDTRFRTTITTGTKSLQDQYISFDDQIYDLRGKTNYDCVYGVGPYNSQACRQLVSKKGCNKKTTCPYVIRRNNWCDIENLRLTNASFQIEACPALIMQPENRANLIIIDECHDLPSQLVDHSTLNIDVNEYFYTSKLFGFDFGSLIRKAINSFENKIGIAFIPNKNQFEAIEVLKTYVFGKLELLESNIKNNVKIEISLGAIEELQNIADKLDMFLKVPKGEWILMSYGKNVKVNLKPVYAYQVSNHGMFRKSSQFVHMSATICGHDLYAKSLGITDYKVIDLNNPIPKENRKIIYVPALAVSKDFDRGKLGKTVDKIIELNEGESGVVHSVSFKLAQEILEFSKYRDRMLISNKREEILSFLKKKGNIVVSPSIETGYDFKDQLCRWQIIAKVPFPYIGDPFIKLNMDRDNKWYSRETILRIVQASGRAVRGVEDYAVTYIIDSNFTKLKNNNKEIFPKWWLEALIER